MKRTIPLLSFILLSAIGFSQTEKNLVHDNNASVRNHTGFTAVDVSGAIDLYLSQGTEEAVAISASSDEIMSRIRTEMRGNVLRIYFDTKGLNWRRWGNHKMKAYVTFKKINGIEASGACNVRVSGIIRSDKLSIEMSGASDFKGEVLVDDLKLQASGASRISVNGKTDNARVDANGASDLRAYDLTTNMCTIDASGSSVVRITVNKELKANATGSSAVYYKGEGLIRDINTSGGSTVKRRNND